MRHTTAVPVSGTRSPSPPKLGGWWQRRRWRWRRRRWQRRRRSPTADGRASYTVTKRRESTPAAQSLAVLVRFRQTCTCLVNGRSEPGVVDNAIGTIARVVPRRHAGRNSAASNRNTRPTVVVVSAPQDDRAAGHSNQVSTTEDDSREVENFAPNVVSRRIDKNDHDVGKCQYN